MATAVRTRQSGFERALSLFRSNRAMEAIPLLQTILQSEPTNLEAHLLLGMCCFNIRDFPAAETCFRGVLSRAPHHHIAAYNLGQSLERQGRRQDAVNAYRQALRARSGFPEAQARLAALGQDAGGAPSAPLPSSSLAATLDDPQAMETQQERPHRMTGELLLKARRRARSFGVHWSLASALLLGSATLFLLSWTEPRFGSQLRPLVAILLLAGIALRGWLWLRSICTRYCIYERRIDFEAGILFRKRYSVWLYEIVETWLSRSPLNLLTGDSVVHFQAASAEGGARHVGAVGTGRLKVTGLGGPRLMAGFWEEIRDASLVERRALKKWWV